MYEAHLTEKKEASHTFTSEAQEEGTVQNFKSEV